MKQLLNTLFVTSEDAYLSLDGENVVVNREKQIVARFPLHTLTGIIAFCYAGASPALMGACADRNIALSFCTPRGRFLARACGESNGNVLLRRTQYRIADDPAQSCRAARGFIFGKLYNTRWSIERSLRDHKLRLDESALRDASTRIKALLPAVAEETSMDSLRGLEGVGAAAYFSVFDELILHEKEHFLNAAAVRLLTASMRCCLSYTVCWRTTVPLRWKRWGWIPMLGISTVIGPDAPRWRLI